MENILRNQKDFQLQIGYNVDTMSKAELTSFIKEYATWLMVETGEMLNELPFAKPWKKTYEYNTALLKTKEEFTDIFIFMLNIAIGLGLDFTTIERLYYEKLAKNKERQLSNY